jgi:hypothetical protein
MRTRVATITYCLSEAGRDVSLKFGGSGAYHQNAWGVIGQEDLALFDCNANGTLSVVLNHLEFDELQTFPELLAHVRARRARFSAIKAVFEAEAIAENAFGAGGLP